MGIEEIPIGESLVKEVSWGVLPAEGFLLGKKLVAWQMLPIMDLLLMAPCLVLGLGLGLVLGAQVVLYLQLYTFSSRVCWLLLASRVVLMKEFSFFERVSSSIAIYFCF